MEWTGVGRVRDFPQTVGDLEALLDEAGPHFELDGYLWCARCQRAYPVGDLRVVKSGPGWTYYEWALECAVDGCPGRRADWYPWHSEELPRALHLAYPDRPEAYAVYPLEADEFN